MTRIGDDAREVGVQPQAQVCALLGMELRRDHVIAGDDGGELHTVLGDTEGRLLVRLGVVRMHEVEVTTARHALDKGVVVLEADVVPADLWHLETWRWRKATNGSRQDGKALDTTALLAAVEQELLADAHAEERATGRG